MEMLKSMSSMREAFGDSSLAAARMKMVPTQKVMFDRLGAAIRSPCCLRHIFSKVTILCLNSLQQRIKTLASSECRSMRSLLTTLRGKCLRGILLIVLPRSCSCR